jgi:hypothetical protein
VREFVSPETPIKLIIYQSSLDLLLISQRKKDRKKKNGRNKKLSFFDKLSKSCSEEGTREKYFLE